MQIDGQLTASALLTRGLFHDRIVPPLSSNSLGLAIDEVLQFGVEEDRTSKKSVVVQSSRCTKHSVPKKKLAARRVLSVPNPCHQTLLALKIEKNWPGLRELLKQSSVSLTTPVVSQKRGLQGLFDRRAEVRSTLSGPLGSDLFSTLISPVFTPRFTRTAYRGPFTEKHKLKRTGRTSFTGTAGPPVTRNARWSDRWDPNRPDTRSDWPEVIASAIDSQLRKFYRRPERNAVCR